MHLLEKELLVSELEDENVDMVPLFEAIIENVHPPKGYIDEPLQMLVTSIDYNEYVGKIGIGKIKEELLKRIKQLAQITKDGTKQNVKVSNCLYLRWIKKS